MSGRCLKLVWKVFGSCLEGVWKAQIGPVEAIRPWKVLGSVCMFSRLCMEGVWKVHVRCLEVGWKVFCWPLLVGVWRVSKGCYEGVF